MSRRTWAFIGAGLVVAVALAFFVSPYASSQPDGLNKVAADKGFDSSTVDHPLGDSPLAEYGVEGVDDAKLSKGISGVIGVALTFAVAYGVVALVRIAKKRNEHAPAP